MAKRLHDSDMLSDSWYRKLSLPHKLLWKTLLDECDFSGVWKVDTEHMDYMLGHFYDWPTVLAAFAGRVVELGDGGKWMVVKFIAFQYGRLNPINKVHASVIKSLTAHGVDPTPFLKSSNSSESVLQCVHSGPTVAPTAKDKEKEKAKDKDKEIDSIFSPSTEVLSEADSRLAACPADLAADLRPVWAEIAKDHGPGVATKARDATKLIHGAVTPARMRETFVAAYKAKALTFPAAQWPDFTKQIQNDRAGITGASKGPVDAEREASRAKFLEQKKKETIHVS